MLRRAAQPEPSEPASTGPNEIDAALWSSHGEAQRAVNEAEEIAVRVANAAARHRAMIEGASERASAMVTHAEGLTVAAARVGDVFERLSVVALNAGLEGARTAEPQGKALLILSEEIRSHVARGAETARDLVTVVEEIAAETGQLRAELDEARNASDEAGRTVDGLGAAVGHARQALGDVERHLRRATGIDPEVARAVAQATEHARGLLSALSTLSTAAQNRTLLLGALRPAIAPLSRLLRELWEEVSDDEAARPSSPPGDGGGTLP
jgi:exonuclease SbcC